MGDLGSIINNFLTGIIGAPDVATTTKAVAKPSSPADNSNDDGSDGNASSAPATKTTHTTKSRSTTSSSPSPTTFSTITSSASSTSSRRIVTTTFTSTLSATSSSLSTSLTSSTSSALASLQTSAPSSSGGLSHGGAIALGVTLGLLVLIGLIISAVKCIFWERGKKLSAITAWKEKNPGPSAAAIAAGAYVPPGHVPAGNEERENTSVGENLHARYTPAGDALASYGKGTYMPVSTPITPDEERRAYVNSYQALPPRKPVGYSTVTPYNGT